MRRVIKITIAVAIVVAVVAILIHPYVDGLNSVARKHYSHRVVLVTLLFFAANKLVPDYNSLAASASPVVQNAGRDLLAQICTRLC
jgi:siroheme synthase